MAAWADCCRLLLALRGGHLFAKRMMMIPVLHQHFSRLKSTPSVIKFSSRGVSREEVGKWIVSHVIGSSLYFGDNSLSGLAGLSRQLKISDSA